MVSPVLQDFGSQTSLTLDNFPIVKSMKKNCIVFLLEFSCLSHCIVKSCSSQNDIKPFASESLNAFNFKFGSDWRHKDCSFDFEGFTAVGNALSMVSSTCSDDSSFFFLFSEGPKGCTGASDFETANFLKILSFEVDFSVVFFGEILRFGERSMFDDTFTFAIRLVNSAGRYQFRFVDTVDRVGTVALRCHSWRISI